jgi:response regulator RpfG family c-di-GMP phosphodiesterase
MALKYKHTILLVDDEESITKALRRLFRKEGYQILTASGGRDALEQLKNSKKAVSLIISDQRMPQMTGAQFFEKAKAIVPNAIRFLLTGYSDMAAVVDAVNKGEIHRYLTKPWNDDDLILQVRQGLEQFELVLENRRLLNLTKRQNHELSELNRDLEKKVNERTREITQKKEELEAANKELETSFKGTIRLLSALVETLNPTLGRYMSHTARVAKEIAEELGLNAEDVDQIEMAGMIHDIGLLGLPEKIWAKDERDMNEKEAMGFHQHPVIGGVCLESVEKLSLVGEIILHHHEQCDGGGFPNGLAGDEIPLGSRIIGVASGYCRIVDIWERDVSRIIDRARKHLGSQSLKGLEVQGPEMMLEEIAEKMILLEVHQRYDMEVVAKLIKITGTSRVARKTLAEKEKKQILRLAIDNLTEGMVLAKSLRLKDGRLLAQKGTRLKESSIKAFKNLAESQSITQPILVLAQEKS